MKSQAPLCSPSVVATLFATTLLAVSSHAQQVAPDPAATAAGKSEEESVFVLSPFEVTAGDSGGYAAATTLAGNRLNTELRDIGSAVTVVTEAMLRDIGAINNETLLQYTPSTEVGGMQGTLANAGSGTQLDETSKFTNPNQNTRVRGLTAADNTRDFFLTDIPWDGYNVDRVDFQRGPNAILFGLGSPAGIINAGTKSGAYRNKGQIEFRTDQYGSLRFSLDVNRVLVKDQVALRIAALDNHEKFQQEPAYQHDKRLYGAIRLEPGFLNRGSAHTTFKANFEQGKIRSNRPRTLTPGDGITPWFYTGTAQGYTASGAPLTYNNLNRIGLNAAGVKDTNIASTGVANNGQFVSNFNTAGVYQSDGVPFANGELNRYWQPWLGGQFGAGGFNNPMAIFDSGASSAVRYLAGEVPTVRGINAAGAIDGNIAGIPQSTMTSLTIYRDISKKVNLPGAKFGLTRNLTLSDPTVFDFYNNLIDGPNKSEWQNFKAFNLNLAQTFWDNRVGFEAVYDRQSYDNGRLTFMTDKGQVLYIDPIQTLADGSANPNFGRPFIGDSSGNNRVDNSEREAYRITGFAKHDFAGGRDSSLLARILGRHILTGLYSHEERNTDGRDFMRYGTDLAYKNFIARSQDGNGIDASQRAIYPVVYLGASLKDRTSASGAYIPAPTALQVAKTGSIRTFDSTWAPPAGVNPGDAWTNVLYPVGNSRRNSTQSENPANYKGWVDVPFNVLDSEEGNRDALTRGAQLTRSEVSSKAIVWQGYLWNGALIPQYGYREDTAKAWTKSGTRNSFNQVNLDPSSYVLPVAPVNQLKDSSSTFSLVTHINKFAALDRLLPVNLSLFYNQSQNFQPAAIRVDAYGVGLPAPKGDTKDFGVLVATKDGRYSVKLNRYETVVENASVGGFPTFLVGGIIANGTEWANVYEFNLNGFTMDTANQGDGTRWTYGPRQGQTAADAAAEEAAAIAGWRALQAKIPKSFTDAWAIEIDQVKDLTAITPIGFAQTERDVSKGYELELYAQPTTSLRLMLNVTKSQAVRYEVGGSRFTELVDIINTALNTTPAGNIRGQVNGRSDASATTTLQDWNASFYASYKSVKVQEGNAVPELREWRANLIANYDFKEGWLKGLNLGAAYRWQDKVVIGYKPVYLIGTTVTNNAPAATDVTFDLNSPFYGPAEHGIDLWAGYEWKLKNNMRWRTQINVRNVGQGNDLIPITVQPDGTPAAWRIAPAQVWSLTNTFSF
ncbi:MAG: TonB-dependent receptor plug domain-containing protein [Verrucomicrobiota bacterium]